MGKHQRKTLEHPAKYFSSDDVNRNVRISILEEFKRHFEVEENKCFGGNCEASRVEATGAQLESVVNKNCTDDTDSSMGSQDDAVRRKRRKTKAERNKSRSKSNQDNPDSSTGNRVDVSRHIKKAHRVSYPLRSKSQGQAVDHLAITQNRLTKRLGLYNKVKKSSTVSREPIVLTETTKKQTDDQLRRILTITDDQPAVPMEVDHEPVDIVSVAQSTSQIMTPQCDPKPSRVTPVNMGLKSHSHTLSSTSTGISCPSSAEFSEDFPENPSVDDIANSLAEKLEDHKIFKGRDVTEELCHDLYKLLKHNTPRDSTPASNKVRSDFSGSSSVCRSLLESFTPRHGKERRVSSESVHLSIERTQHQIPLSAESIFMNQDRPQQSTTSSSFQGSYQQQQQQQGGSSFQGSYHQQQQGGSSFQGSYHQQQQLQGGSSFQGSYHHQQGGGISQVSSVHKASSIKDLAVIAQVENITSRVKQNYKTSDIDSIRMDAMDLLKHNDQMCYQKREIHCTMTRPSRSPLTDALQLLSQNDKCIEARKQSRTSSHLFKENVDLAIQALSSNASSQEHLVNSQSSGFHSHHSQEIHRSVNSHHSQEIQPHRPVNHHLISDFPMFHNCPAGDAAANHIRPTSNLVNEAVRAEYRKDVEYMPMFHGDFYKDSLWFDKTILSNIEPPAQQQQTSAPQQTDANNSMDILDYLDHSGQASNNLTKGQAAPLSPTWHPPSQSFRQPQTPSPDSPQMFPRRLY